jgi:hypothetical protein
MQPPMACTELYSYALMIETTLDAGPTVFYFTTRPRNITTSQSRRIEFHCSIRSTLIPTFKWNFTRKGSRETETIAVSGTPSAGYSIIRGHRSQVLIIPSVQWRYEGVYTCTVSSENSQIQAEASLNVLSKQYEEHTILIYHAYIPHSSFEQNGNHREQQHSCKTRRSDH